MADIYSSFSFSKQRKCKYVRLSDYLKVIWLLAQFVPCSFLRGWGKKNEKGMKEKRKLLPIVFTVHANELDALIISKGMLSCESFAQHHSLPDGMSY